MGHLLTTAVLRYAIETPSRLFQKFAKTLPFFFLTSFFLNANEDPRLNDIRKAMDVLLQGSVKKDYRTSSSTFNKAPISRTINYPFENPVPITPQKLSMAVEALSNSPNQEDQQKGYRALLYLQAMNNIAKSNASQNPPLEAPQLFMSSYLESELIEAAGFSYENMPKDQSEIMSGLRNKIFGSNPSAEQLNDREKFNQGVASLLEERIKSKIGLEKKLLPVVSPKNFETLNKDIQIIGNSDDSVLKAIKSAVTLLAKEACPTSTLDGFYTRRLINSTKGKFRVAQQSTIQCHSPANSSVTASATAYMNLGGLATKAPDLCKPTQRDLSVEDSAMISARQREAMMDFMSCPYVIDRDAALSPFFIANLMSDILKIKKESIPNSIYSTNNFLDISHMLAVWKLAFKNGQWTEEKLASALKEKMASELKVDHEFLSQAKRDRSIATGATGAHSGSAAEEELISDSGLSVAQRNKKVEEAFVNGQPGEAYRNDPFKNHGPAYMKNDQYSQLSNEQSRFLELCIESEMDTFLEAINTAQQAAPSSNEDLLKIVETCSKTATNGIPRLLPAARNHAVQAFQILMNNRTQGLAKLKAFEGNAWTKKATPYEKGLDLLLNSTGTPSQSGASAGQESSEHTNMETLLKAYNPEILKKYGISFTGYPERRINMSNITPEDLYSLVPDHIETEEEMKNPSESLQARAALSALLGDLNYDPRNENATIKDMRRFKEDIRFFQTKIYKPENAELLKQFKSNPGWLPPPLVIGDSVFIINEIKLKEPSGPSEVFYSIKSEKKMETEIYEKALALQERLAGKNNGDGDDKGLFGELEKHAAEQTGTLAAFQRLAAQYAGSLKANSITGGFTGIDSILAIAMAGNDKANEEAEKIFDSLPHQSGFKAAFKKIEKEILDFEKMMRNEYGFRRYYATDKGLKNLVLPHHEALYGKNTDFYENNPLNEFRQRRQKVENDILGQHGMLNSASESLYQTNADAAKGAFDKFNSYFGNPFYDAETQKYGFSMDRGGVYQLIASPLMVGGALKIGFSGSRMLGAAVMGTQRGASAMRALGFSQNFGQMARGGGYIRSILAEGAYGADLANKTRTMFWALPNVIAGQVAASDYEMYALARGYYHLTGSQGAKDYADQQWNEALGFGQAFDMYVNMNNTEGSLKNAAFGLGFGAGSNAIKSFLIASKAGGSAGSVMRTINGVRTYLGKPLSPVVQRTLARIPLFKGAMNVDRASGVIGKQVLRGDLAANALVTAGTTGFGLDQRAINLVKRTFGENEEEEILKQLEKLSADLVKTQNELKGNTSPAAQTAIVDLKRQILSAETQLQKHRAETWGFAGKMYYGNSIMDLQRQNLEIAKANLAALEEELKQNPRSVSLIRARGQMKLTVDQAQKQLADESSQQLFSTDEKGNKKLNYGMLMQTFGPDLMFFAMPTDFAQDMNKFTRPQYEKGVRHSMFGNASSVRSDNGRLLVEYTDTGFQRMRREQNHLFYKLKAEDYGNGVLGQTDGFLQRGIQSVRQLAGASAPNNVRIQIEKKAATPQLISELQKANPSLALTRSSDGSIIFEIPKVNAASVSSYINKLHRNINFSRYNAPLREVGRTPSGNRVFEVTDPAVIENDIMARLAQNTQGRLGNLLRHFRYYSLGAYTSPNQRGGF